jgi:hypothetical protein
VPKLLETIDYLANATGFHEFAEFTAQDIGTVDSGLNSMVLASNNERVILPVSESPAVASGLLLWELTRSFPLKDGWFAEGPVEGLTRTPLWFAYEWI